jgi:1,4-alpha-glucan branching enzyme
MTTAPHNCIRLTAGDDLNRLLQGRLHAPHNVLGRQAMDHERVAVLVYLPHACAAWLLPDTPTAARAQQRTAYPQIRAHAQEPGLESSLESSLESGLDPDRAEPLEPGTHRVLQAVPEWPGLFCWTGLASDCAQHPRILWQDTDRHWHTQRDAYSFPITLSHFDLHLFGEGHHWHAHRMLGAHPHTLDGIAGVRFAVWAPSAERVSVVGDFNRWDGRYHPMTVHGSSGVWELFIPELPAGTLYKFEIRNRDTGELFVKTDPYGRHFEQRPHTASRVLEDSTFVWGDASWLQQRAAQDWQHRPLSIYEVHLGSWQRGAGGRFLTYREIAERLIPYVRDHGFTHIELLPVTEHPLDGSWGYQSTGFFAPTSRFGSPDDFRFLVDRAHQAQIGVLLDWVPGHFPKDHFALARFDGSALYEHADPRRGEHRDWGTLIFNYGRAEVRNFLLSSALCWIEDFHLDGLRVDAVASMLYLDYSRQPDDWIPNEHGGNENLEAIAFLRELNRTVLGNHPGVFMIAEESTAWPGVSRPPDTGGLGFTMKWNMGWMHDTLSYLQRDPIHRAYHHHQLTFGMLYAYSENFVLPFSHDEVVHGKGSLRARMPGNEWQQHAQLRLLYAYQWTYPGKKLLFMGQEFGQGTEWNADRALDWYVLDYPLHQGLLYLVRDLNHLYRDEPALHAREFDPAGFSWLDCDDAAHSILSYARHDDDQHLLVVLNFTPVERFACRIPAPQAGTWSVRLNTDSRFYGGASRGSLIATAKPIPYRGFPAVLEVDLPPLGALILTLE